MTQQILGTLYIAVDLPMPERLGALLALEQADKPADAVGGFRLQPLIVDPPSRTAAEGRANIKRVLANRRVLALIGPSTEEAAAAMLPIADKNGLLNETMAVVAPYMLDPCLTQRTGGCPKGWPDKLYPKTFISVKGAAVTHVYNFHRLSPTSDDIGGAAADYAAETLDATNALVLYPHTQTSVRADDFRFFFNFQNRFQAVRKQQMYTPTLDALRGDRVALLRTARAAGVDVVVFTGSGSEAGLLRKQMIQAGFPPSVPLLGGPAMMTPDFFKAAGKDAAGSYAVQPRIDPSQWDPATDFMAAFRARYPDPKDYDPLAAYAYDAARMLVEIVRGLVFYTPVAPSRDDVNEGFDWLNWDFDPTQPHSRNQPLYDGVLGRIAFTGRHSADPNLKLFSYWTAGKTSWSLDDQAQYRG